MKNKYLNPVVVAEIGCNHMGSFEIAKELILLAKDSGANYAKFQKRHNKELLSEEQYNTPHPNPSNSYGNTYGDHREFLEFDLTQHYDLNISNMTIIHDEDSLYKELTHGDYFCTGYHCFKYGENNVTSFVREEYGLNDNKMKNQYAFIETREYTNPEYGRNRTTIYIFN